VSKIDILGAQDERVYVEFSTEQLAGLGVDRAELIAALHAQNAVTPAGVVQTEDEKILVRVSGAFRSEQDVLAVNFVAQNGRIIRLGDIAHVTRGPADPAQPMFRVNAKKGIGLAIAMRAGGDVLALGRNIEQAMTEITANLPVGIEPTLVADQPVTVEHAVDDFMEALWEAIAIVLAVSLVALGLRAGAVVAISIPLVLATVFVAMKFFGIDLQRISLGALIIALGLLVDDAMITIEAMVTRLERGDEKEQAGIFAYASTALPRLAGTLVTVAGVRPDRVRAECSGRVHVLDFCRRRHRTDSVLGGGRPVCTVARGLDSQEAEGGARGGARSDHARLPPLPGAGDAGALGHGRPHAGRVRSSALRHALRATAVLSGI
jgi:multidrug efflux pump subunit AcrB